MRRTLLLFTILLCNVFAIAQTSPSPPTTMHRTADTTKDKSGHYYGKSTEGHFSVLLPIPFDDFTMQTDSTYLHMIGAVSKDGIKFSAAEIPKKKEKINKPVDLDAIVNKFRGNSNTIANIKKGKTGNNGSVYFSVYYENKGATLKYVNTSSTLYVLIIEYPIDKKEFVDKECAFFFSSLKINP